MAKINIALMLPTLELPIYNSLSLFKLGSDKTERFKICSHYLNEV